MTTLGTFLAELWLPIHFLFLVVFLGLIWLLIRLFNKLRPFTGQLLVLAGVFWLGLMFYLISFSFPAPSPILRAVTDASTIPRAWFYALLPIVVLTLIPILRGKESPDPKWGNLRLLGIILATLIISISLFNVIGYYISSVLFIVVTMWLLGSRSKTELIAVPIGWVVFSYFIFARLLHVRLPIGSIFSGLIG